MYMTEKKEMHIRATCKQSTQTAMLRWLKGTLSAGSVASVFVSWERAIKVYCAPKRTSPDQVV